MDQLHWPAYTYLGAYRINISCMNEPVKRWIKYSVFLGYLAFGRNYAAAFAIEGFKEKVISGLRSWPAKANPTWLLSLAWGGM